MLWFVIPAHDDATQGLPPGRYLSTFDEIRDRFVLHDDFADSPTRVRNWAGLQRYVRAWQDAEARVGKRLLLALWIAGSFTTMKPDPGDIDVTPIYDFATMKSLRGQPGVGDVKKLLENRDQIVAQFHVEPFGLPWVSTGSSLFPEKLPAEEQKYLLAAGGLTDFWQRFKHTNEIGGPAHAGLYVERGFLEVIL